MVVIKDGGINNRRWLGLIRYCLNGVYNVVDVAFCAWINRVRVEDS